MSWVSVDPYIGRAAAFVIAVIVIILWAQGSLPKEWALGTLAVCAVRL